MQRKKKTYIIIMIISTVILLADIVAFVVTKPSMGDFSGGGNRPSFSMEEMPDGFEGFSDGEMPEDFEGFSDGEMPEGFEGFMGGQMPGGFGGFSGEMPEDFEGFSGGEMPEGFEGFGGGEMPEGFEDFMGGQMPTQGGNMPGMNKWRLVCIPIAIICVVVDIICAIGLFRLKKGTKKVKALPDKEDVDCPIDPVALRLKKKKRQQNITIVVLAFVLVGVLVLQLLSSGSNRAASSVAVNEEVITAQVETGSIERNISGSGVLSSSEDIVITVPGNVTITKYYVTNGDNVAAGDVIAAVDKNSVRAAIADVEELLDELDDEVTEVRNDSISSQINATVDGTVVAVYGEKNESVVDVMYEHGALALVSLDELLALELENSGSFTVGDKVTVTDKDGNAKEGQVTSVGKETLEVTVSMDDFDFEEEVKITDAEGKELGSGKLYIYSQQKITGYSGTISSVKISAGDSISEGNTLFTLTDTDYSAAYQVLLSKRAELEDQYNQLVEIASTGYVYAKEDGSISSIEGSVASEKQTTESAATVENMSTKKSSTVSLMKLSSVDGSSIIKPDAQLPEGDNSGTQAPEGENSETQTPGGEAPDAQETVSKSVNIVWLNADGSIMTEGIPEKVTLQLKANGVLKEKVEVSAKEEWSYTWTGLPKYENGAEIQYTIENDETFTGYKTASKVTGTVTMMINTKEAAQSGTNVPGTDGQQPGATVPGGDTQQPSGSDQQGSMSQGGTTGGMTGGFTGGMSGDMSGYPSEQDMMIEEIENTYIFEETSVCTLSPNDVANIEIQIDELDINKISLDQTCEITLSAFTGQNFEGKVIGIDKAGENSGGNTKYTVTIQMNKQDNMLLGMNASVKIPLQTAENVLVIPEAALVEKDGAVYVYTEYKERGDELGGLVEVTTGLSDGENVEILSGLEADQDYFYRYAETISYTFL